MPIHTTDALTAAACMVANAIDDTAQADTDTLLRSRHTLSHVVIITHRGQKFSVPLGTAIATANATAANDAPPQPANTAKETARLAAKTVKKTASKRPTATNTVPASGDSD